MSCRILSYRIGSFFVSSITLTPNSFEMVVDFSGIFVSISFSQLHSIFYLFHKLLTQPIRFLSREFRIDSKIQTFNINAIWWISSFVALTMLYPMLKYSLQFFLLFFFSHSRFSLYLFFIIYYVHYNVIFQLLRAADLNAVAIVEIAT